MKELIFNKIILHNKIFRLLLCPELIPKTHLGDRKSPILLLVSHYVQSRRHRKIGRTKD